jgi:hypothetical protein
MLLVHLRALQTLTSLLIHVMYISWGLEARAGYILPD